VPTFWVIDETALPPLLLKEMMQDSGTVVVVMVVAVVDVVTVVAVVDVVRVVAVADVVTVAAVVDVVTVVSVADVVTVAAVVDDVAAVVQVNSLHPSKVIHVNTKSNVISTFLFIFFSPLYVVHTNPNAFSPISPRALLILLYYKIVWPRMIGCSESPQIHQFFVNYHLKVAVYSQTKVAIY
jgi:hypothetical protein